MSIPGCIMNFSLSQHFAQQQPPGRKIWRFKWLGVKLTREPPPGAKVKNA
jgi:hypothetical protein